MTSRNGIAVLFLCACASDPETASDLDTVVEEAVIGPSGTAMWDKAVTSPGFDHNFSFRAIAATPEGEVVAVGLGNGDALFGDGNPLHLGGAPTDANVAVIRYDVNGRRQWQRVAARAGGHDSAEDVVVGPDGSIAIWGVGSPDFGCGTAAQASVSAFYVVRLDADGACLFMHTLTTTRSFVFGSGGAVAIDRTTGDVLTVATVLGELLVDGESVWDGPTEEPSADLVLLRFAADGELLDVASSANGQLQLQDLGVDDAGRVVVSGTMYSAGGDLGDGFVAPTRMAAWVVGYTPGFDRAFGHVYGEDANVLDMDVHPDGHVALFGAFRGDLDFGNTATHTPFVSHDLYVVKLDAAGEDQWNRHIWGDASLGGGRVAFDPAGFVIIGGAASGGVLRIGAFRAVLDGDFTMFLARFGANTGSTVWARVYDGGAFTAPFGLAVPWNARRFYVAGAMSGSLDLGDDRGPLVADSDSSFIARMVR